MNASQRKSKLSRYRVTVRFAGSNLVSEVEARSIEEAEEKMQEKFGACHVKARLIRGAQ
jgi:hypothetical protein